MFEIKKIFLEPGVKATATLTRDVAEAIRTCADWHATPRVLVGRSDPAEFAKALRAAL